ncbi:MAG: Fur family transcriptional regulator, partial [Candidatus Limnocylindrales bacterium]
EEEVLSRLRSAGDRVTTPRRLLIRCLFEATGHRTAEELAAEIQARAPDVSISTVYRNLEELERLGVVVHSHLGHGPATYHLATAAHGHLVCRRCDAQVEIADGFFADLRRRAIADFGFAIDPRHFAVIGLCASCQAETEPGGGFTSAE